MINTLKQLVVKAIGRDAANRIHASLKRDPRFARYAMKRLLQRRPKALWTQSVLSFESKIALNIESLENHFSKLKMCAHSGGHAIYLHRPEDIESLCPGLPARYPAPFGLKIFKSQSLSPDGTVYYTSVKTGTYTTPLAMWAVGSARDKLSVGNLLSLRGITPKVHDLIWLTHPTSTSRMAMVVEHVGHDIVCGNEGIQFMDRFKREIQEEGIVAVGKSFDSSSDFLPPTFNDNIVRGENGPLYVDIQTLALQHPKRALDGLVEKAAIAIKFDSDRSIRKCVYPYKRVPWVNITGNRDMLVRTAKIESMLHEAGCELRGARVLDVGCSLGLLLAFFLSRGARFCIGMDRPEVVTWARRFLYHFGFSRFELIGADLRSYDMQDDAITGEPIDVMLLTSMSNHIGFPPWLEKVNWRYLIYEGHGGESLERAIELTDERFPGAAIITRDVYQDGDSPPRPLVVLRRK